MKVSIIGAGNMGSAIAKGMALSNIANLEVTISNRSQDKLTAISREFPQIRTTTDNATALKGADIALFAVKPWVLPLVADSLKDQHLPSIIISIVAGYGTERLETLFGQNKEYYYVIPNTALTTGQSMTFIAPRNASPESTDIVKTLFSSMGKVAFIEERLMSAATALSSCGIAYAFKYIQACVQAGVQLGFTPKEAQEYAVATVKGAMSLLSQPDANPQNEINKVTTPGGITIRGINKLEETGFVSSIITSILEPMKNE